MYNMELNMSELDNINNLKDTFDYNNYTYNQENYWEKQQIPETKTKKKVSFDDILTNMNLVVNNQGVLQMMTPVQNNLNNNYLPNKNFEYNPNEFYTPTNENNFIPNKNHQPKFYSEKKQSIQKNNEPIDPNLKHSYIYNKYFKDYNDNYVEKTGPRIPKTIEEYKQMLLDDKIKAIQHKKMIEQIKPKKMMFTSNPGMSINPINVNASRNNLRNMSFR